MKEIYRKQTDRQLFPCIHPVQWFITSELFASTGRPCVSEKVNRNALFTTSETCNTGTIKSHHMQQVMMGSNTLRNFVTQHYAVKVLLLFFFILIEHYRVKCYGYHTLKFYSRTLYLENMHLKSILRNFVAQNCTLKVFLLDHYTV